MSSLLTIPRPPESEYRSYFSLYIDQVDGDEALAAMRAQIELIGSLTTSFPVDREEFAYDQGKWSVREVVGHMIDTERVFAHRALWFARNDSQALPGYDQDEWAPVSNAKERALATLAAEFASVRAATLSLFEGFDQSFLKRAGHSDGAQLSVGACAWIIVGHFSHHRTVLADRYAQ